MNGTGLKETMAALEAALVSGPVRKRPDQVRAGVDLGTAYTVPVALDGNDRPLAAAYELTDVVRDGVVTDFVGAIDVLRRLKVDVEARLGVWIPAAHGAYPPGVALSEVRAVQHVIEAADMECSGLVDEPTGGTHLTLVIAGALGISFEEAGLRSRRARACRTPVRDAAWHRAHRSGPRAGLRIHLPGRCAPMTKEKCCCGR